jgi:hypothetical protein
LLEAVLAATHNTTNFGILPAEWAGTIASPQALKMGREASRDQGEFVVVRKALIREELHLSIEAEISVLMLGI